MASKLNVILEGRARDRGMNRYLRDGSRLAGEFAENVEKAAAAGSKLGVVNLDGAAGGRRGPARRRRAGGPHGPATSAGSRRAGANSRRAQKEFDRALNGALKDAKAQAKALDRQAKAQERAAKNIENLSKEELVAVELQREINRRRRSEARSIASQRLGPDPTAVPGRGSRGSRGRRGRGNVDFGASLAIAGAEFEQFGAQVEGGVREAFNSFKDYEKAVTEVTTLTDDISADQIKAITQDAAAQFGGLPTDQVAAFYSIVSAGATTASEAQAQLIAANKLAVGGVAEQEEAVLAITKAVANFGVTSEEAADSIFTSVRDGQTTVSQLASALPEVASAAADSGLTLDETNAALAVLSKRLKSPAQAATSLNQALTNIQKPTKMARDEAKRLGIDFSVAGLKAAGSMEEFILQLQAAEKFDDNTIAKLFDSSEAQKAIRGLIGGMGDLQVTKAGMATKLGEADRAEAKMADTAAQKAAKLDAQWQILKITAGEALVPALTELAEGVGPIIKDVTAWIKANPELAATIGKVAIGVAVTSKGVGALTSGLSMMSSIIGVGQVGVEGLSGAFGGLSKVGPVAGKALSKLGPAIGTFAKTAGPLALAAGAGVAIGLALDRWLDLSGKSAKALARISGVQEEMDRLDKVNNDRNRSFTKVDEKTGDVVAKSDEEVLLEQRSRLAADVAAKQTQLGNATALDRALGLREDFVMQLEQSEADLARFDARFGDQVGLTSAQRVEGAGGIGGTIFGGSEEDMAALIDLFRQTAQNTAKLAANSTQQPWKGPSMDAGLT